MNARGDLVVWHVEGCLVAKNDTTKPKHELIDATNLEVIMLMKSMTSRGYVRKEYNWRHYYWYLTDEGIEYLRKYLHLPADVVPATHKKQATAAARPGGERYGDDRRGGYGKDGGPGRDFRPSYRDGGFGRGGGGEGGYRREGGFGRGN